MISEEIEGSQGSSCESENDSKSSSSDGENNEEEKNESYQFHSAITSKVVKIGQTN